MKNKTDIAKATSPVLQLVYLLALFLTGLGYIAILPAFEGIDEPGQFSSIRQIADTRTIPFYGESFLDKAFADYRGPRAYATLPPYDVGMVYSNFFKHKGLSDDYKNDYREPFMTPLYRPAEEPNHEVQHPPLYYGLLAPFSMMMAHASVVTQIFFLRFVSYLFAMGGVLFGLLALNRGVLQKEEALFGFFLYPLILPAFFPEFARISNDSLCLFLVGLLAWLLSLWREREYSFRKAFAIGLTLAIGLLTKSFFLPISVALIGFLALRLWRNKKERDALPPWASLILMASTALFIGGGWYLYELINHGVLSGNYEAIRLAQNGSLLKGLDAHFTPDSFIAALVALFADFSWMGSRSLVQIHPLLQAPLLIFILMLVLRYKKILGEKSLTDFDFLPVWFFTFLSAWVVYLVLYNIAGAGSNPVSGGYVHILMPLLAPALGASLFSLMKDGVLKSSLDIFLSYAALFQIMAVWCEMALFAGCSVKGINGIYAFKEGAFCLSEAPLVVEHLSVLGLPYLAVVGFGGGLMCALYLVKKIRANTL